MSILWKISILIGSVLLCGGSFLAFKTLPQKALKLLLSFSGAYILALCLFHLIPDVYFNIPNTHIAGGLIAGGFLLQIILDFFSGGIEHGHIHSEHHHHGHISHKFPTVMFAGLCVHGFIEGFPLMLGKAGDNLFVGILLHNLPISIALVTLIFMVTQSKKSVIFPLIFFASMTPLGAFAAYWFFPQNASDSAFGYYALALVIGIFLHISTTILFESDQTHRFNLMKLLIIILGVLAAFFIS
jgi:zinc transporter ZupT